MRSGEFRRKELFLPIFQVFLCSSNLHTPQHHRTTRSRLLVLGATLCTCRACALLQLLPYHRVVFPDLDRRLPRYSQPMDRTSQPSMGDLSLGTVTGRLGLLDHDGDTKQSATLQSLLSKEALLLASFLAAVVYLSSDATNVSQVSNMMPGSRARLQAESPLMVFVRGLALAFGYCCVGLVYIPIKTVQYTLIIVSFLHGKANCISKNLDKRGDQNSDVSLLDLEEQREVDPIHPPCRKPAKIDDTLPSSSCLHLTTSRRLRLTDARNSWLL